MVEGATVDKFRPFIEDPVPVLATINKRIKPEKLEDLDGYPIYNMWVESPNTWVIAHRSSIVCVYTNLDGPNGSIWMINSSIGNEDLIEKYKEKIGKDVVAN